MPCEYVKSILEGAALTLALAGLATLIAILAGLLTAAAKLSTIAPLRWAAAVYTTVIRGIPDLVLMLLVFYGGQMLVNELANRLDSDPIDFSAFWAGTLTIGFIFGAFFGETFRGAFLAVPRGQMEAGAAFGMSPARIFRRILFPQMLRYALPGLGNNWLVLLKSTAIVSMIGLADMVWMADQAGRTTRQPFLYYMVVCALYMMLTAASGYVLRRLERRYGVGVVRAQF
jgi:His/Glu/Gln/Arg/opine family amino acid ABC transporter permease subunit